jgi:DNA-binding PadR family transcriptional regulator
LPQERLLDVILEPTMAMTRLSELEACVLALIWADGPATPYAVRQVFLKSPSPQWSGSAGSIYPLLERLEHQEFIRSVPHSTGERQGRVFSLAPAGRRALKRWLNPDIPAWVAGVPPDPLRTRIRFLGAVPVAAQREFLAAARRAVDENLRIMLQDYKSRRKKGGFEYWMARGALMAMRARRAWLSEMTKALG